MSDQFRERVGRNINKYRTQAGLTLKELAEKVGVSEATMQKYEKGNIKTVGVDFISKLANALDVRPEKITGWDNPEEYAAYKEAKAAMDCESITEMYSQLTHGHKKAVRNLIRELLNCQ